MPTEQELKTFLAELQERHPLKDGYHVPLLFGGWGFASTDVKDRSIVLPRSWLKNDAWSYFVVIHEYAHLLSEDRTDGWKKTIRHLHNFLGHDKTFKKTENELTAEYGIRFKRWLIYPRAIETPWGNVTPFDFFGGIEMFMQTLACNFWGMMVALLYLSVQGIDISNAVFQFIGGMALIALLDNHGASMAQSMVRRKYRKYGIRRRA